MTRTIALLLLTASSTSALAAPFTTQMTCAQARGIVAQQGSVVLHESALIYDRYVSNRGHCQVTQATQPAFIRTRDAAACPVGSTCIEPDHDRDSLFDR